MLGDLVRLEASHRLKSSVAQVTVVTFTLVDSLDVQLEAILQGVGCPALLAAVERTNALTSS